MTKKSNPLRILVVMCIFLFLVYFGLVFALGTNHFLATVSSDSMKPALERGDWVFIKSQSFYAVNDTLVFSVDHSVYVHRVVSVVMTKVQTNSSVVVSGFRTKGDANPYPDGWTVLPQFVLGKVIVRVPRLGYLSLWLDGK